MSNASTDAMARASEERAEQAEQSPWPVFLRIGRVVVWIVWALVLVTAILLLLAFVLQLFGANPDAGFVQWVERSTQRAMAPFRGIFPTHQLSDDSTLDMSLLFAAIVYFIVALLIDGVLRWITQRLRRQEREAAQLRVEADQLARQAAAERHAAQVAGQEAAAREYARQQAAADQYAVAQAAAQEALAHQQAQAAAQSIRAKPAAPAGGVWAEPATTTDAPPTAPPPAG
jgi:uncharacterized protein YggT (Ycf19 family)